ncbi:hypothetical protein [Salinicoccus roseus]|uniref:hypothetical protein n=1 Tax=Salinicoccus roseus TaxID=45670 RepID=UPI002300B389|nr:hypothetical protein [Salinicoccus roseus]
METPKEYLSRYILEKDKEENPEKYSKEKRDEFFQSIIKELQPNVEAALNKLGQNTPTYIRGGSVDFSHFSWNEYVFRYVNESTSSIKLIAHKKHDEVLDEIKFHPEGFSSETEGKEHKEVTKDTVNNISKAHIILIYEYLRENLKND